MIKASHKNSAQGWTPFDQLVTLLTKLLALIFQAIAFVGLISSPPTRPTVSCMYSAIVLAVHNTRWH